MVLDHLQIGGNVVELAFGILFGGIVLTLALAIGLGSRDLVSRSLESHAEHSSDSSAAPSTTSPDDSIRISEYFRAAEDGVVDLRTVQMTQENGNTCIEENKEG